MCGQILLVEILLVGFRWATDCIHTVHEQSDYSYLCFSKILETKRSFEVTSYGLVQPSFYKLFGTKNCLNEMFDYTILYLS